LIIFNPGESNKTVAINILNDSAASGTKQFSLNLFGASTNAVIGAKSAATVTIVDAGCMPAPAGLVGWWTADGHANDLAGNNQGALHGGVTFAPGEVGQAFSLDGAGGYVEVGNPANFNFGTTSPMSVDLWAFRTGSATIMHLLGKRDGCAGAIQYQMAFDSGGLLFGGSGGTVRPGWQLPLNTWVHLAATFDGSTLRFYTNGVLAKTAAGTLGPTNNVPLTIGASGTCGSTFAGKLDDIRVYSRALTALEIQAIFNSSSEGMCPQSPPILSGPFSYNGNKGFVLNAILSSGQNYRIQASTNLNTTNWIDLTNFTAGVGMLRFTNFTATNFPQRFYRIVSP
jgi:hypothetical protein